MIQNRFQFFHEVAFLVPSVHFCLINRTYILTFQAWSGVQVLEHHARFFVALKLMFLTTYIDTNGSKCCVIKGDPAKASHCCNARHTTFTKTNNNACPTNITKGIHRACTTAHTFIYCVITASSLVIFLFDTIGCSSMWLHQSS